MGTHQTVGDYTKPKVFKVLRFAYIAGNAYVIKFAEFVCLYYLFCVRCLVVFKFFWSINEKSRLTRHSEIAYNKCPHTNKSLKSHCLLLSESAEYCATVSYNLYYTQRKSCFVCLLFNCDFVKDLHADRDFAFNEHVILTVSNVTALDTRDPIRIHVLIYQRRPIDLRDSRTDN